VNPASKQSLSRAYSRRARTAQLVITLVVGVASAQSEVRNERWLADANGCKFISPAPDTRAPDSPFSWTGACVDGFLSGPGVLSTADKTVVLRGEFTSGRIANGTLAMPFVVYEGEFRDNIPHGDGSLRFADGSVLKAKFVDGRPDESNAELTWPGGARYRGQIDPVAQQMSGKGTLELGDGAVYEGEFKENRPEGVGVYRNPNGNVLRGTFVDGLLQGPGTIDYGDRSRYEGELRGSLPNGHGRMARINGDVYEGYFVGGNFQGKGRFQFSTGDVYEGEFLAGNFHGAGTFTWAGGDQYTGQYLNGLRHGQGRRTLQSHGVTLEGEWKNDEMNGKCRVEGPDFLYEGDCANGRRSGRGRLSNKGDGAIYEGDFRDNEPHGNGVLRSGEYSYEGSFKAGKRHGRGAERRGDTQYDGEFADNLRHGHGVLREKRADGVEVIYDGMFARGSMNGAGTLIAGKLKFEGDFLADIFVRGTITGDDGRRFEVDMESGESVEILEDGTRQPMDAVPADFDI
jgi:hypothetical protein